LIESARTKDRRTNDDGRRTVLLVLAGLVSGALMILYAAIVPPGQPADEPAHWMNVVYYEHERRLPELGDDGVSYEAQMGPVYYTLAALVAWPLDQVFGAEASFYGVRGLGAVLAALTLYLTYVLGVRLFPRRRSESAVAAAFVGLLPPMFSVGASVQNDHLTIVLATVAALVAIRALDRDSPLVAWALIGSLIGFAVLCKVSALGLLFALVFVVVCSPERRRVQLRGLGVAILFFALVCGWWFIRNQLLYGDFSARGGLDRLGLSFPPIHFDGFSSISSWLREWVAAMWMPTEYYRNAFAAPQVLRVAVVVWTVVLLSLVVLGAARAIRGRRLLGLPPGLLFVIAWVAATVVGFSVVVWTYSATAPRFTYVALPGGAVLAVVAIARATRSSTQRFLIGAVTGILMVVCVVFIAVEVTAIPRQVFWIDF
jgi:D-alanyl-D-alanine carboxypeptidase (penicillin-binding protein 5/6)